MDHQAKKSISSFFWSYRVIEIVIIIATFMLTIFYQHHIDINFANYQPTENLLLQNPETLKTMLPRHQSMVADMYWLRTVQFLRNKHINLKERYQDVMTLIDIVSTMDPDFLRPFRVVPLELSWFNTAHRADKGIEMLNKGIRLHPNNWELYLDRGFIYYVFFDDYKNAGRSYFQSSLMPNAPDWTTQVAFANLIRDRDYATIDKLFHRLSQTATTDQQKEVAQLNLQWMDSIHDRKHLQTILARYHQKTGKSPLNWQQIIDRKMLAVMPHDAFGKNYQINTKTEEVSLDTSSPLYAIDQRYNKYYVPVDARPLAKQEKSPPPPPVEMRE